MPLDNARHHGCARPAKESRVGAQHVRLHDEVRAQQGARGAAAPLHKFTRHGEAWGIGIFFGRIKTHFSFYRSARNEHRRLTASKSVPQRRLSGSLPQLSHLRLCRADQPWIRITGRHRTAAAAAPVTNDDEVLRVAMAASESAYLSQRTEMLNSVLEILRACSPILGSYVDEHCGVFGVVGPEDEVEVFSDFRRTVDSLLADLLHDVHLGMSDVALTLTLAREQPDGLVEHLLAVESFDSFRRMSACTATAASPPARDRSAPGPG